MLRARAQFGHGVNISGSSSFTMDYRAKLWVVTMTASPRTVTLPSVLHPQTPFGGGADIFAIANDGGVAFNLRDFELTNPLFSSASIAPGKIAFISAYFEANFVWVYSIYNWEHG